MWRYVGYLLGIREENNPCTSIARAGGTQQSMNVYLLQPNDRSREVARHVLKSVAAYHFTKWNFLRHCQFTRFFLGRALADKLGIPFSFWHAIRARVTLCVVSAMNYIFAPFAMAEGHPIHAKVLAFYRSVRKRHMELPRNSGERSDRSSYFSWMIIETF